MVHGLHVTRLHDAVSFGQVLLCEGLVEQVVLEYFKHCSTFREQTYHLITCVANLLAHELVDPLGLIAHVGVDAGNNERHDGWDCELNGIKT